MRRGRCRKVADAADGRLDPGFGEPLGVLDRNVLGAAIAMMNEAAAAGRPSVMERLFEGVQDEVGVRRPAGSPADDPPRVGVDDEGDIDEAGPGRDIGKIREPQTVRRGSMELPVHMIQRTESRLVADRCPQRFAPDRPPKAHIPHQPGDRAASGAEAFPPQLPPDLAHAIDAEVLLEHAPDLDLQIGVSADPGGQTGGIGPPGEWAG